MQESTTSLNVWYSKPGYNGEQALYFVKKESVQVSKSTATNWQFGYLSDITR